MNESFEDRDALRTVANYQFGGGTGRTLFPTDEMPTIKRSFSGRPKQVIAGGGRLVSVGTDGRFTLGFEGGRRIQQTLDRPRGRVVVGDESAPFVREGKNVFAKFVQEVDEQIRVGDEILVVHESDELLGVGRAELSPAGMLDFETGMAVMVREGADQ